MQPPLHAPRQPLPNKTGSNGALASVCSRTPAASPSLTLSSHLAASNRPELGRGSTAAFVATCRCGAPSQTSNTAASPPSSSFTFLCHHVTLLSQGYTRSPWSRITHVVVVRIFSLRKNKIVCQGWRLRYHPLALPRISALAEVQAAGTAADTTVVQACWPRAAGAQDGGHTARGVRVISERAGERRVSRQNTIKKEMGKSRTHPRRRHSVTSTLP